MIALEIGCCGFVFLFFFFVVVFFQLGYLVTKLFHGCGDLIQKVSHSVKTCSFLFCFVVVVFVVPFCFVVVVVRVLVCFVLFFVVVVVGVPLCCCWGPFLFCCCWSGRRVASPFEDHSILLESADRTMSAAEERFEM